MESTEADQGAEASTNQGTANLRQPVLPRINVKLEIAQLRAGLVARVDAGRARDILLEEGVGFREAVRQVLDARTRWRRLAAGVVTAAPHNGSQQ